MSLKREPHNPSFGENGAIIEMYQKILILLKNIGF